MHIALSLVGFTFLVAQCHSQVSGEIDRQYPAETVLYQYIDRRNLGQENSLHRVPRAAEQLKYKTETNYPQETRPQPSYSQEPTSQVASHSVQDKKPTVEQFLKEVTPTTKTVYDPRNQKAESQLYNQWVQETHKQPPIAQNILAYQNAIIARQNAIYEKQRADQLQKQADALPHPGVYLSHYVQDNEPNQKFGKFKTSSPDDEYLYYTNLQYEREFKKSKDQLKAKQPAYKTVNLHKAPVPKVEKPKAPDVVYYSDVKFEHEYNNNKEGYKPKQPYIKIEHVQNHLPVQKVGIPKIASPEYEEGYVPYAQGFNNRKGKLEDTSPYRKPEITEKDAANPKTPDVVYYSDVKFEHEYNHKNEDHEPKQPYINIQTSGKKNAEAPNSGAPDVVYYSDIKFEHEYNDNQKHDFGSEPYIKSGDRQKDRTSKSGNPEHDLVYYSDVGYEHEYNDHSNGYKQPNIKTKHSHKSSTLHKSVNTKSSSPEHDYYSDSYGHEFNKNKDDFESNQPHVSSKNRPKTSTKKLKKTEDALNSDPGLDHYADAEYDYEYSKHRAQIESDEPYVDTHYGNIEYEYNKQRDEIEAEHPYIKSHHSEIDYDYNKQKDDIEALQPYGKPQSNRKSGLEGKQKKANKGSLNHYHPAEDLAARYADFEYEYELTKKRAEFAEEPYSEPEYDDDKTAPVETEEKTPFISDKVDYRTKVEYGQGFNEVGTQKPTAPKFHARIIQNSQPEIILLSKENQPDHRSIPHSAGLAKQPKDKVFVSDVTYQKNAVYQPDQPKPDVEYYAQPQFIQYQIQPAGPIAHVPNQKGVAYQQPSTQQPQQSGISQAEQLKQYQSNAGQYHAGPSTKLNNSRQRVQYLLVPEVTKPVQRYSAQQYSRPQQGQPQQSQPAYLGPTDEEYEQSELKQKLGRNSSLRVLKTGKPVVFIGHEE